MIAVARSGSIGDVRSVEATFTKLTTPPARELDATMEGGSLSELATYPLLAIVKLLGEEYVDLQASSLWNDELGVETFSRLQLRYPHAIASATTGLGVKSEGCLVVSGTRGYIYVPAPWWKTEYFEARFENQSDNKKFYYKFDGDGLRYEIAEFSDLIRRGQRETFKLRPSESAWIARVIESSRANAHRFG